MAFLVRPDQPLSAGDPVSGYMIAAGMLLAANRIIECGHGAALYIAYRERRIARYRAIAANNPSQNRFLRGWQNRANEFDEF